MSDASRPDPDTLHRLWHTIHAWVRPRVRADQADDVVQETLLSALKRPPADPHAFEPWLRVVARNVASRARQRDRARAEREHDFARAQPHSVPELDESGEPSEVLRRLANLPEPFREALHLRYVEELAIEDVARRLGRPQGTVRSQIKRGLDRLREQLLGQDAARARRRRFGFVWLRTAASRLGRSPVAARATLLVGSAGACGLALVLLLPRERPAAASEPEPVASVPQAQTPTEFDWRTTENRSDVPLDALPVPEERDELREEPWPTDVLGRVLDDLGRAVSGAEVLIGGADGEPGEAVARTDALGRFRLVRADGRRWLWAARAGSVPSRRTLLASVGPEQELTLALGPPLDLMPARVRNAAGEPLPGAEVFLLEAQLKEDPLIDTQGVLALPRRPLAAVADAEGRLSLGCRPGQRVRVKVLARGEPPLSSELIAPPAGQVLELVLPRSATLQGRLALDDGTPVGDAGLRLELRGHSLWQETRTDADGRFRLGDLPPGRFELTLSEGPLADGLSLSLLDSLRVGETRTLELRASRASTLSGRAARAGTPLAGWTVELERLGPDWLGSVQRVRTNAEGRFAFGSCALRFKHRLRLIDPDSGLTVAYASLRAPGDELFLEPDDSLAQLTTFGGRLRADQEGREAAFVELYSPTVERRWVSRVDSSGAFAFSGLPPVQCRVRSWHHGVGPVDHGFVKLQAGETLKFRPERTEPGWLELEVRPPPGVAIERVQVALQVPALYSRSVNSLRWLAADTTSGRFGASLPAGEHEFLVLVDHVVVERRGLTIEPHRTHSISIALPELVPVTIALVDEESAYLHESLLARFGAELAQEVPLRNVPYQPHDRYELLLPAGTTRLRVEAKSGRAGEWRRDSALGHGEEITVALGPSSDAASK